MWYTSLTYLSAILYILCGVPYILSILRGHTTPHRTSWIIWTANALINVSAQYASGSWSNVVFGTAQTIICLIVICLSVRYGVGGHTPLDIVCLALSLGALVLWGASSLPLFAIYGTVLADAIGSIPTITKVYHHPRSENLTSYLLAGLGGACSLLAVIHESIGVLIYPLYILSVNASVISISLYRRRV